MGNRSDVHCRYRDLHLKRSGREAMLLAQLSAAPAPAHHVTSGKCMQRQFAQLMAKRRPMKTQLPAAFGHHVTQTRSNCSLTGSATDMMTRWS
jgi:hypothetical protein